MLNLRAGGAEAGARPEGGRDGVEVGSRIGGMLI